MTPSRNIVLIVFLLAVGARLNVARGDAIVVTKAMKATTIAEIFVEKESIRVELEIGQEDLLAFRNLLPDDAYRKLTKDDTPVAERRARYFSQDFLIRADAGPPLRGEVRKIEQRRRLKRDEITGEPIAAGDDEVQAVWFVEIHYRLTSQPKTLSLTPPTRDEGQSRLSAASIGFVLYHSGLPATDFRYLSIAETLDLDWEDPWYSRFRNRNLRRQFDAPLSAFLYVEHFEIRKEIVVRPKDLEQWMDLKLDDEVIPVARQEALKQQVADFLLERNQVTVDGQIVQPKLDRIHFIRRSLRKTGVIEPAEDLDVTSATLGVIFVYPNSGLPKNVRMTWDMFSERIQKIPAIATDQAGGLPTTLTVDDPVLEWKNFLTNPKIPAMLAIEPPPRRPTIELPWITVLLGVTSVGLAWQGIRTRRHRGRLLGVCALLVACAVSASRYRLTMARPFSKQPAVTASDADVVLAGLLHNLYRAFDRREESLVYDRLAHSVAGDLLREAYLSTRRSLELANQGGARVKVLDVKIESTNDVEPLLENVGFRSNCQWTVTGSVGHWGHTHRRTNRYSAVLTVEPLDGDWKITSIEINDQQRLDPMAPRK